MVSCHDKTAYITTKCSCGYVGHIHQTQLNGLPPGLFATRCRQCHDVTTWDVDWMRSAIRTAWNL